MIKRLISSLLTVLVGATVNLNGRDSSLPVLGKKIEHTPLTIMIHGTRFVPLSPDGDSSVHRALSRHLGTPAGLRHVSELKQHHAFVELAHALHEAAPTDFSLEGFYFFGWPGKLRSIARSQAGKDLTASIKKLRSDPQFKHSPITIITHSHGGNAALYSAESLKDVPGLLIDRLILLACPIQDSTEHYAYSTIFKRIYNLFSGADLTQIMDPQKYVGHRNDKRPKKISRRKTTLFSRREFAPAAHIKQAKLRWHNRAITHLDFMRKDFCKRIPQILKFLDNPALYHEVPCTKEGTYCIKIKK